MLRKRLPPGLALSLFELGAARAPVFPNGQPLEVAFPLVVQRQARLDLLVVRHVGVKVREYVICAAVDAPAFKRLAVVLERGK